MGFFDKILGIDRFGQVSRDRDNLLAGFLGDLCSGRLQRLFAPRADRDIDAFAREAECDRLANALASARDEGGLSFCKFMAFSPPWRTAKLVSVYKAMRTGREGRL